VRRLGLPVTEVTRYWYDERYALRRGLSALMLAAVTGMVAGVTLGAATETLENLPGLLLLVPAAIDMRGNIYGALASRLATAIHIGEYDAELRRRSFMGRQVESSSILTIATSAVIALMAWGFAAVLGLPTIPVWHLIVIATVGGVLSSAVLLVVTVVLSRVALARGWNMDDVGAPTITVTGDVLTIPALLLATLLVRTEPFATIAGIVLALIGLWALWVGWVHADPVVRRIVRESAVTLAFAAAVGTLAGTILESRLEEFIETPILLVLVPPFVANCGSLGGMLSSRLASKLHLGLLEPRLVPGKMAALDISVTFVFATGAFTAIGAAAWAASLLFGIGDAAGGAVIATALLSGLISTFLLAAVAYATAAATYRFGLDPDNEGIPIVTSAMDLLGLLSLVGVAAVFLVG
jgi:mgtE-like transporter